MKGWGLLKIALLLESELCNFVLCTFTITPRSNTAVLCSNHFQSWNRWMQPNDSPLLPALVPHSLRQGQAGILREPGETDTHCLGIWEQLCWLLPLSQKSNAKGQARKVGGRVWHSHLCSSTASKGEMKGSTSPYYRPSQSHLTKSLVVSILSGKVGCLKTHFKDEIASITFWKVLCMTDKGWRAERVPLHAATFSVLGIAGVPDAVTVC